MMVVYLCTLGTHTYIGTTDTDYTEDPSDVSASSDDVSYSFGSIRLLFSNGTTTRIRCDLYVGRGSSVGAQKVKWMDLNHLSLESIVSNIDADGLISIAGGKLTIIVLMGQEVIEKAIESLQKIPWFEASSIGRNLKKTPKIDTIPFTGAMNWPEDNNTDALLQDIIQIAGQSLQKIRLICCCKNYGTRSKKIAEIISKSDTWSKTISKSS